MDRLLIERFLAQNSQYVRGAVLEVRNDRYVRRFGHDLSAVDVVDIDATNKDATIVADLSAPGALQGYSFDCIVLTQVLQYTPDPVAAMSTVCNALAPGGCALITVPMVQRVAPSVEGADYWRFTPDGLVKLVDLAMTDARVEVFPAGNLLSSVASLLGLGGWDMSVDESTKTDPRFGSIVCARVLR